MSAGFPQMVLYPRGRIAGQAGYVRRIWEQYTYHPVMVSDRSDLKYWTICFQQHWAHQEFLLVEHSPNSFSIFTQETGDSQ